MESHSKLALLLGLAATAAGSIFPKCIDENCNQENVPYPDYARLDACPGYNAINVDKFYYGMRADLVLAGEPCNVYGEDLETLSLEVTTETPERLHIKIQDKDNQVYQVPETVLPRPNGVNVSAEHRLQYRVQERPFSFAVLRKGEVLFDSSAATLVFETQYTRLRTVLPMRPNLYGLGQHSDSFRLPTEGYVRTLWNQDQAGLPPKTNLHGSHPMYMDHRRGNGTHGVFLLNSNGMDVIINRTMPLGFGLGETQYLEYNMLGGVVDMYFFGGPLPVNVTQQYGEVVGRPPLPPYWSLGFHQSRQGYRDVYELAEVIHEHEEAGIPLEAIWADADYMDGGLGFTLDEERFPRDKMRALIDELHRRGQRFISVVHPAIGVRDHPTLARGLDQDVFLKRDNGSQWLGVAASGVSAYPDWLAERTADWWTKEIGDFFDADHGLNVDGLWVDMSGPSSACDFPCDDPYGVAAAGEFPPEPPAVRRGPSKPLPGFPKVLKGVSERAKNGSLVKEGEEDDDDDDEEEEIETQDDTKKEKREVRENKTDKGKKKGAPKKQGNGKKDRAKGHRGKDKAKGKPSLERRGRKGPPWIPGQPYTYITTPFPHWGNVSGSGNDRDPHAPHRGPGDQTGLPHRDLLHPKYAIRNAAAGRHWWNSGHGGLSNRTVSTDVRHANRMAVYDTHNLYGAMAAAATRAALLARRPTQRTFAVAAAGHFPGAVDALALSGGESSWAQMRASIRTMVAHAALFQKPLVGSDACGFAGNATEELCARWAALSAFMPLFRNHNARRATPQEFYRWPLVAEAARRAIAIRYRLLDYLYTALWRNQRTGIPPIFPLFYLYPNEPDAYAVDHQFFFGQALLVAPVVQQGATDLDVYLPADTWFDWYTHRPICGRAAAYRMTNVQPTDIPLFIRGGSIIPIRARSANTTDDLRTQDYELIIAMRSYAVTHAAGRLYLDDGLALHPNDPNGAGDSYIDISFTRFRGRQIKTCRDDWLTISGVFRHVTDLRITKIHFLGFYGCYEHRYPKDRWSTTVDVAITLNEPSSTLILPPKP